MERPDGPLIRMADDAAFSRVMARPRPPLVIAAVGAVAGLAAAVAFVPLRSDLGIVPAVLCFGALAAAATALGTLPAGVATLIAGALLLDFFYFPPFHTLYVTSTGEWVTLLMFVAFNVILCVAV